MHSKPNSGLILTGVLNLGPLKNHLRGIAENGQKAGGSKWHKAMSIVSTGPKRGQIWSYRALDTTVRNFSMRSTRWAWFQHFSLFSIFGFAFLADFKIWLFFRNRWNRNRRNRILKPNRWNRNQPYQRPNRTEPRTGGFL